MKEFCETKLLVITFYELYVLVLQTQTRKMIMIFAIFFRFFENFCHFLSFLGVGVKKLPLGFDKGFDDRLLHSF